MPFISSKFHASANGSVESKGKTVHLLKQKTQPIRPRRPRKTYELYKPHVVVPTLNEEMKEPPKMPSSYDQSYVDVTHKLKGSKRKGNSRERDEK